MGTWLHKEWQEMLRLGRWIPLWATFIFLGVMQPITFKLLPSLLSMGNLPEGTVIQIPPPTPGEVLNGVVGQYNQLGLLALILVAMGSIAGERHAVGEWLWSRPVVLYQYVLAKFLVLFTAALSAILLGFSLAGYYTQQLIGAVSWSALFQGALLYGLYAAFLISLILCASAIAKTPTIAGGLALIVIITLNLVPPLVWDSPHFISGLLALLGTIFNQTAWTYFSPAWEPVLTTALATLFLLGVQLPILAQRKLLEG